MKMTKKQVQKAFQDLKNGLSIILALVLLTHSARPLQAIASVQDEAGTAASAAESAGFEQAEAPKSQPTVQDVLLEVCEANEKVADPMTCARHLLGIVMTESDARATAIGDSGYARGWFQINRWYNPEVDVACAEDLECSASWTLDRLLKHGYGKSAGWTKWAIWCHNGCGIAEYYVPKVLRKASYHWDKPIALVTAEEARSLAKN